MVKFEYKWFEKISLSPAWDLVPHAMIELTELGFLDGPAWGPDWNANVVVAMDVGKAIGFIAYSVAEHTGKASINGAWVKPGRRSLGVHTEMFAAIVRKLQTDGNVTEIMTETHARNTAAQMAFKKQGRELFAYRYRYVVQAPKEGIDV